MITRIDEFLLQHIFGPICWKITEWTGINRFVQARGVLLVYVVSRSVEFMDWINATKGNSGIGYVSLACAIIIVAGAYSRSLLAEKLSGNGLNPEHQTGFVLRIFWVCLSTIAIPIGTSYFLGSLAVTAAYYFIACSSPPPKPRVFVGRSVVNEAV